jgi:hypothetical protein
MIQRCTNPKGQMWAHYGGANPPVRVCERWRVFENFLADLGEAVKGDSLSRYLDTGNYEPGNVEWATRLQQGAEKAGKSAMLKLHAYHQLQLVAA